LIIKNQQVEKFIDRKPCFLCHPSYLPGRSIDPQISFEAGTKEIEEGLAEDPGVIEGYVELVCLKRFHNDLLGAEEVYSKGIRLNPENFQLYLLRGNIRRDLGNIEGAVEDCQKALDIGPPIGPARAEVIRDLESLRAEKLPQEERSTVPQDEDY
jgi:tetratricopeptide (TPR) repeat protein